ncbi:hypothetical protein BDFG_09007 [Blastomyces dermatitidis ATCC 26199]|nr:hypothetical protein BDFG_09007 [Blastomyces dermatitidis ATCC 26199]
MARKSRNAAPYQQQYMNGKQAHRRTNRSFLEYCYLCAKWFPDPMAWKEHCTFHLNNLQPRCGILTLHYTLVAPGFCPDRLGDESMQPDERFQQWRVKSTLLNHIDEVHLMKKKTESKLKFPHPCCEDQCYEGILAL